MSLLWRDMFAFKIYILVHFYIVCSSSCLACLSCSVLPSLNAVCCSYFLLLLVIISRPAGTVLIWKGKYVGLNAKSNLVCVSEKILPSNMFTLCTKVMSSISPGQAPVGNTKRGNERVAGRGNGSELWVRKSSKVRKRTMGTKRAPPYPVLQLMVDQVALQSMLSDKFIYCTLSDKLLVKGNGGSAFEVFLLEFSSDGTCRISSFLQRRLPYIPLCFCSTRMLSFFSFPSLFRSVLSSLRPFLALLSSGSFFFWFFGFSFSCLLSLALFFFVSH